MRSILFFLLVLACTSCATKRKAQHIDTGLEFTEKVSYKWKRAVAAGALCGLSGAAWGVHETVVHHPGRIPANWNQQFWDARQSWRNKYRHGDPTLGPAFPGSTTALAWTTDAKHLSGTLHRTLLFSGGLVITIGERRPWWHYAIDLGLSYAMFSGGFHGVYSGAFRQ